MTPQTSWLSLSCSRPWPSASHPSLSHKCPSDGLCASLGHHTPEWLPPLPQQQRATRSDPSTWTVTRPDLQRLPIKARKHDPEDKGASPEALALTETGRRQQRNCPPFSLPVTYSEPQGATRPLWTRPVGPSTQLCLAAQPQTA